MYTTIVHRSLFEKFYHNTNTPARTHHNEQVPTQFLTLTHASPFMTQNRTMTLRLSRVRACFSLNTPLAKANATSLSVFFSQHVFLFRSGFCYTAALKHSPRHVSEPDVKKQEWPHKMAFLFNEPPQYTEIPHEVRPRQNFLASFTSPLPQA